MKSDCRGLTVFSFLYFIFSRSLNFNHFSNATHLLIRTKCKLHFKLRFFHRCKHTRDLIQGFGGFFSRIFNPTASLGPQIVSISFHTIIERMMKILRMSKEFPYIVFRCLPYMMRNSENKFLFLICFVDNFYYD